MYAPRATFSARHSGSRGHRHEQVVPGNARHLGQHRLRLRNVLEHLGRGDQVELGVGELQVARHASRGTRGSRMRARRPLGLELGVLEIDADDTADRPSRGRPALGSARPRRSRRRAPTPERRDRTARRACARSRPSAGGRRGFVEPYLSNVLPVGVGRVGRCGQRHTPSASRSPGPLPAALSAAPGAGSRLAAGASLSARPGS